MGEWPTIFDKSATLTLGDGRRIFVASPLGLGEIGRQIANHQTQSLQNSLCCAVEGRQEKNGSKMSQLLRLVGGLGVSAVNNQNMPRKVNDYMRMGKLIAFPLPPMTLLPLAGSLGMARSLAPTMIDLPSLEGIDVDNPNVTTMDEAQRMLWVLHKCGEILDRTGKSEIAAAFKQLLAPEIIGLIVAGLIVWGASHFVGVGFIFDIAMVVVIGVAVLKAFETMWEIYKIITKASTKTELTKAAKMMADMVIDIGVEAFLAIVLKGAAKSRFRAPPSKAAGSADEVVEYAAPTPRRGKSESAPTDKKSSKTKPVKPTEAQLKTAKKEGLDPKWVNEDGSIKWPTEKDGYKNGFDGPSKKISLDPPDTFDRYGGYVDPKTGQFKDTGKFSSPVGVPKEQRAVTPATLNKPYMKYRVKKSIPNVESGKVAPWFDQPGGGTQHLMPMSIDDLLKGGYIEPIG